MQCISTLLKYYGLSLINCAFYIGCMQCLICFLASRFSQILFIQFLDCRILMRFTDYLRLIIAIQYACTNTTYISEITHITGYLRLTASVDTSARTSHDLDKVILFLTRFHLLQKFSCIAEV